jgi:hypothetical protein
MNTRGDPPLLYLIENKCFRAEEGAKPQSEAITVQTCNSNGVDNEIEVHAALFQGLLRPADQMAAG